MGVEPMLSAQCRFQGRVMYRLLQRAWLLSEIGDIWGVGRQYVHWLITLARQAKRGS